MTMTPECAIQVSWKIDREHHKQNSPALAKMFWTPEKLDGYSKISASYLFLTVFNTSTFSSLRRGARGRGKFILLLEWAKFIRPPEKCLFLELSTKTNCRCWINQTQKSYIPCIFYECYFSQYNQFRALPYVAKIWTGFFPFISLLTFCGDLFCDW